MSIVAVAEVVASEASLLSSLTAWRLGWDDGSSEGRDCDVEKQPKEKAARGSAQKQVVGFLSHKFIRRHCAQILHFPQAQPHTRYFVMLLSCGASEQCADGWIAPRSDQRDRRQSQLRVRKQRVAESAAGSGTSSSSTSWYVERSWSGYTAGTVAALSQTTECASGDGGPAAGLSSGAAEQEKKPSRAERVAWTVLQSGHQRRRRTCAVFGEEPRLEAARQSVGLHGSRLVGCPLRLRRRWYTAWQSAPGRCVGQAPRCRQAALAPLRAHGFRQWPDMMQQAQTTRNSARTAVCTNTGWITLVRLHGPP